ncbi:WAT1-related protein At1g25270-like [Rhodamnia argentea]|uniref:WAT1-related protein n=1 Tax=Rhodamnia argentea TaxID=178133 RepID=A0A8B8PWJ4_9MYRT|nr:WAT1-related protein At1g25270-like [Rhodamnia argentea]
MKKRMHGAKPAILMVAVQAAFAGVNVMYKLAANDGMNLRLVVAYRLLFATAFMAPLALFFERKKRPKLTGLVLFQAFCCGLFGGSLGQNLYLESLALTSATYAAAMANLIPAITYIMAVSCGLERVVIGRIEGKAKVLGTLMGIGGAMVLTFYKGFEIRMWSTHVDLLHHHGHQPQPANHHPANRGGHGAHALGSMLAVGSCVCYALWLIIQAKMVERYPCHYSGTALISLFGSIQAVGYALCTERDWSEWKLGWNIRFLTVVYTGLVASGMCVSLIGWCVHKRGPLFASVFSPLMLVLVALAGSFLLDEKLHLGSLLGAGVIVCGLYVVLWGKRREMRRMEQLAIGPCKSTPETDSPIQIVITSHSINSSNDPQSNTRHVAADADDIDIANHESSMVKDDVAEELPDD